MLNKLTRTIGCLAAAMLLAVPEAMTAQKNQENKMTNHPKTLVVYYSHTGNTKRIADKIATAVSADTARIETVVPYTGTPEEISAQGQREVESGYRPEIKPLGVNPADYDRIVIGTPTWWYTMAPAVLSFFFINRSERQGCRSLHDQCRLARTRHQRHDQRGQRRQYRLDQRNLI